MSELIEDIDPDIGIPLDTIQPMESVLPGFIDPEFMETLRGLGVDSSRIEFSEDVLSEPVEILVNLAKNGDINPWDIDIVNVTDIFLERIEQMQMMDLRISGRTLLYASILLRMKSTGIIQEEQEDYGFEDLGDDLDFYDVDDYPVPKLPIRRQAARPVTLQELILELQKAEKVETRRKDRSIRRRLEERSAVTTDEVLGIAHEEDILGRVKSLGEKLRHELESQEFVKLSDLLGEDRSENIMTYVSLLFLATEKKIWLTQRELFGELYVYPFSGGTEAV
ncbi:segregation and condensation protein A [Methanolobus chelungpuianus]|uniref:Chromosome segregation protein ScpA n=1 Tax=Methanolobus chelungpuianus TaxID=502115 RepID=A0AAE3KVA1_9EURY|nr:ScpA family protein [Methanolobus chelungpuianus]MCQ6961730.1 chromosome segregation protein ScpA [Methanolobus chelungpuianus]